MAVRKICLYKNITTGNSDIGGDSDKYFTVLGNFQHMRYHEVEDFSEIVEYQPSENINGSWYSIHQIFFFDTDESQEELFKEIDYQSKFFMVSTLTLNKYALLRGKQYGNSKSLLDDVKKEIVNCLKQYATENFGQAGAGLSIGVYAGLGSSDIVVTASYENLNELANMCQEIKKILVPKINPQNNKEKTLLFQSSNSFFAVHNTFNLSNAKGKKSSSIIYYSLSDLESGSQIFKIYRKIFGAEEINRCSYMFGDYDLALYIKNCDLPKQLYFWGVRDNKEKLPFQEEELMEMNALIKEYNEKNINSRLRRILGKSFTEEDYTKLIAEEANDMPISEIDHLRMNKIKKLEKLQSDIYESVPVPARRTLKFLVDKCVSMLRDNSKYAVSLKTYTMLHTVMISIKGYPYTGKAIVACLGNISSTINAALMADSLSMDHVGINYVETINSSIKLFYAYEGITRKIHEVLNHKNDQKPDPLFFLTIKSDDGIKSMSYLLKPKQFGTNIHSINFPDINYFDPELSIPYLAHELSHYVDFGQDQGGRELRNETMLKIVNWYIINYTWHYNFSNDKNVILIEEDTIKEYEGLIEFILKGCSDNYFEKSNFKNLTAFEFTKKCKGYIWVVWQTALKYLNPKLNKNDKEDIEILIFWQRLCSALQSLHHSPKSIELFRDVIREVRADIMMCCICKLNYKQYFKNYYRYIKDNMLISQIVDVANTMRQAAVLAVLSNNSFEIVEEYSKTIDDNDESDSLNRVLHFWRRNKVILEALINYSKQIKKNVDEKLDNNKEMVEKILDIFRHSSDLKRNPANLVSILYNEWYETLLYWERMDNLEEKGNGEKK